MANLFTTTIASPESSTICDLAQGVQDQAARATLLLEAIRKEVDDLAVSRATGVELLNSELLAAEERILVFAQMASEAAALVADLGEEIEARDFLARQPVPLRRSSAPLQTASN